MEKFIKANKKGENWKAHWWCHSPQKIREDYWRYHYWTPSASHWYSMQSVAASQNPHQHHSWPTEDGYISDSNQNLWPIQVQSFPKHSTVRRCLPDSDHSLPILPVVVVLVSFIVCTDQDNVSTGSSKMQGGHEYWLMGCCFKWQRPQICVSRWLCIKGWSNENKLWMINMNIHFLHSHDEWILVMNEVNAG